MTYYIHQFRATKTPSEKHIHCLWNHLTDKKFNQQNPDFKIVPNGRIINVFVDSKIILELKDVLLNDLSFNYLKSHSAESTNYQNEQFVHAQGNLSYSIHSQITKKDICPVELTGQLRDEHKVHFLKYISSSTGLDFEDAYKNKNLHFSREQRSDIVNDKVHLNDVLLFDVTARIIDQDKVNSLPYRAIGRRKSYGFGHVHIDIVSDSINE